LNKPFSNANFVRCINTNNTPFYFDILPTLEGSGFWVQTTVAGRYLEVSDQQVLGAASALSMLSPVGGDVGKYRLDDIGTPLSNRLDKLKPFL